MKQKHVPLEKLSKRKKKEYFAAQRGDWRGVNPVTRLTPNLKAYKRKKSGKQHEYEGFPGFLFAG